MPETTIREAPEAQKIAGRLIADHHSHLADESQVRIIYLFSDGKQSDRGKAVLARTKRLTPIERFLESGGEAVNAGADFAITFDLMHWAVLTERQREALVDHELTHIGIGGKNLDEYRLQPHDVEEFAAVIRRHGLWKSDVEQFGKAVAEQLSLFEEVTAGAEQ